MLIFNRAHDGFCHIYIYIYIYLYLYTYIYIYIYIYYMYSRVGWDLRQFFTRREATSIGLKFPSGSSQWWLGLWKCARRPAPLDGLASPFGVSINGESPIAGWFIVENPNLKWMRTGGTPISGNLHMFGLSSLSLLGIFRQISNPAAARMWICR